VPMTVVLTLDVEDRYRGFLSSCMLEVSPCCYVAPNMSKGVRERLWAVMEAWHGTLRRGTITMLWRQSDAVGSLGMLLLGEPTKDIVDFDGVFLARAGTAEHSPPVV
jgi:CRISPR-associated protein Cas2